jgi:hypothetical protein
MNPSASHVDFVNICLVGAMFYVSPTLTMLMLAVVPPVSLGAVCYCFMELKLGYQHSL